MSQEQIYIHSTMPLLDIEKLKMLKEYSKDRTQMALNGACTEGPSSRFTNKEELFWNLGHATSIADNQPYHFTNYADDLKEFL